MPHEIPIAPPDPADRYGIVIAEWNRAITDKLLEGAVATLLEAGVAEASIDVAWTPGSWEIPLVAQRMCFSGHYVAVICLGAVIRGETTHDQHINRGVSLAISQISMQSDVPVLFGVLTCESMEQAVDRAGGKHGNKGSECAESALHMVGLLRNMPSE